MPHLLAPLSRRQFLSVVGAGVGWLAVRPAFAHGADPHRLALLSDTHIPDNAEGNYNKCNMTRRLRSVIKEILALGPKPSGVVIAGDLAWKVGSPSEYKSFAKEIEPLRNALPLHVALGNHDNRANFIAGVTALQPKERQLNGRHVTVIEYPRADLVLLDSLEPSLGSAGKCGAEQIRWLAGALDRHPTKPALLFVHHDPKWNADPKAISLTDTNDLWAVLKDRPRIKALFFGHTHVWKLDKKDGVQLVNLPAVGYPFKPTEVTGWTDLQLHDSGAKLTIHALEKDHANHNKVIELAWR